MRTLIRTMICASLLAIGLMLGAGCERKEKVIEIETPGGKIEVERSTESGAVDVEVENK